MTKSDLSRIIVNHLAFENDEVPPLTKETVTEVIDAFALIVREAVSQGHTITLRGFGSFQPKRRGAKMARNIVKGEPITVPAHTIPVFVPSDDFKAKVRSAALMK